MPVHRILRCQPHPTPRIEELFSRQHPSRILGGLSTSSARLLRKGINLLPRVDAATHEMWEAVGLTNASPRINQLFADLMRGPLAVSEKHPSQGLDLLHRMGRGAQYWGNFSCRSLDTIYPKSMQTSSTMLLNKGHNLLTPVLCGRLHAPWSLCWLGRQAEWESSELLSEPRTMWGCGGRWQGQCACVSWTHWLP